MINYDKDRSTVHIDTGPRVRSRLTVNNARSSDSGNYTCAAANTDPASITVYITEGERVWSVCVCMGWGGGVFCGFCLCAERNVA